MLTNIVVENLTYHKNVFNRINSMQTNTFPPEERVCLYVALINACHLYDYIM